MNKEPETYEELIRYKRCVDLTSYYELSQEELEKIYNFLGMHSDAIIIGNDHSLILKVANDKNVFPEIINTRCFNPTIDGVKLSNDRFTIIPHYEPSSSGGYSGGSSSNNNNNNNNNTNNR